MTKATVNVLLPVFNGASTIDVAMESLLGQSLSDIKVIAIDDGSTDRSPQILADFARADRRVTVIRQNNRGIVDALNVGLGHSDSEFIARQDADDISDPSRLERQLTYLQRHPNCIAVSGAVRHIDELGRFTGNIQYFREPADADPNWAPAREPYLIHPFLMVRRADLVAVGGYRQVHHSEDTDLYWRLLERGKLHNLDITLGDYRVHSGGISGTSVLNGRIMAVSSQLSALSARRRLKGRPDIFFEKQAISEYRNAETLAAIYRLAGTQLDEHEREYLKVSVAGKLLELAAYRSYELDVDDCRFIRKALHGLNWLQLANCRELERLQAGAGARLFRGKLYKEVATLIPPRTLFGGGCTTTLWSPHQYHGANHQALARLKLELIRYRAGIR